MSTTAKHAAEIILEVIPEPTCAGPRPGARRTAAEVAEDRAAIVEQVAGSVWVRPPRLARRSDIDALVASGVLVAETRTEYDKSSGYQANLFGGAAVMVRRRLYVRSAR